MQSIIEDAIHASTDLTLRREMRNRFGKRKLTAEEFTIPLAETIEQGCMAHGTDADELIENLNEYLASLN